MTDTTGGTVASGTQLELMSGDTATDVLVGGTLLVDNGGSATLTMVSGGVLSALAGGSASFTSAYSGGGIVLNGGAADFSTLGNGGFEVISAGGVATSTTVSLGGTQTIGANGTANATQVGDGGEVDVYSGGMLADASLTLNGAGYVYSGGTASGLMAVSGGILQVAGDGLAEASVVSNGGGLFVQGDAETTTVGAYGLQAVFGGYANGTDIQGDGMETVVFGGESDFATIEAAGSQLVSLGGLASGTVVERGGAQFIGSGGFSVSTEIQGGGAEFVFAGGEADGTAVASGGILVVLPGATIVDVIGDAGSDIVSTGVVTVDNLSGTQIHAGTVDKLLIDGVQATGYVLSGGVTESAVVQNGGGLNVYAGGVASDTLVSGFGAYLNISGGSAYDTTVGSGTTLQVLSGGAASLTYLATSGTAVVDGGSITDTTLADRALLDLVQADDAEGSITFDAGADATLELDDTSAFGAVISGFSPGDTIDLTAMAYDAGTTVTLLAGNVLEIDDPGAGIYDLALDPSQDFTGDRFTATQDRDGGTEITSNAAPCFCASTRILTDRGEVPVEQLAIGDIVALAGGGFAPIKWIGYRRVNIARHPQPEAARPVRIPAHAFGEGLPRRALLVSPGHAIQVQTQAAGAVLIPARHLVGWGGIDFVTTLARTVYFHIELDRHDVLLAEGLACESYLDCGNRRQFENTKVTDLQPFEGQNLAFSIMLTRGCARFVDAGPALAEVRARLGSGAAAEPGMAWHAPDSRRHSNALI